MNWRLILGLKHWFGEPKGGVPDDLADLARRVDEKRGKGSSREVERNDQADASAESRTISRQGPSER